MINKNHSESDISAVAENLSISLSTGSISNSLTSPTYHQKYFLLTNISAYVNFCASITVALQKIIVSKS